MDTNVQRRPVAPANNLTGSKISPTTSCTYLFHAAYSASSDYT